MNRRRTPRRSGVFAPPPAPPPTNVNFTTFAQARGLTVLAGWQSDLGVTLNSGNVSQLNDQVGSNHYTQAGVPNQPLWVASDATLNNKPSISFNGSAHALNASALDLPVPPITVYSVFKHRTWVVAHELWSGGTFSSYALSPNTASPQILMYNGMFGPTSSGATIGSWCRSLEKFTNSTSDSLKIGSAAPVTGTNCGNQDPAVGWILARNNGATTFAAIDWAMQLIISGTTSAGDDTALDNAVTSMYGAGVLV